MTDIDRRDASARVATPDRQRVHVPGEAGLWVMIFGDMLIFGLFFVTFAVYRLDEVALFMASEGRLNQGFGLLNTMLLLTSSMFVASAVSDARSARFDKARRNVSLGMVLGIAFVAVKAVEYGEKFAVGITPATNMFFMFYFAFTAIHLLHVIVGLIALLFLRSQCTPRSQPGAMSAIEGCGVFWHLVDILWVVLFAILYLHQ